MIRAHLTALRSLITGVTVYDGQVPDNATFPYVVVYGDQGTATVDNFAGSSGWRTWLAQTTSVGTTPAQARWAAEKVQAALLDVTPTVSARTCGPIRLDVTRPVERDNDVTPPLFYAVDVWRFNSVAA